MVNNQLTVRKILDEQIAQKLWLSKGQLQRTKVGARTMIRESELQKVIENGGKSPAPKGRIQ